MSTTITTEVRNGRTMTVTTTDHPVPPISQPVRPPVIPQYGPEWIAACYGVSVTDPCPTVTLGK